MTFQKPKYLSRQYAETFMDPSVASAYHARPPYPDETFRILASLIADVPRNMLDAGCGLGNIARQMVPFCDLIDAVDFSAGMITRGKSMPHGDSEKLRWQHSAIEDATFDPPYALITAGNCIGWFDLGVMMPRFARALTPAGFLAVVSDTGHVGVDDGPIIAEYSVNQDYIPYSPVDALKDAGLFDEKGQAETAKEPWTPTISEYLVFRHSQNGLSKERMGTKRAAEFDELVRERIQQQIDDGSVRYQDGRIQGSVSGTVVWGQPRSPSAGQVQD